MANTALTPDKELPHAVLEAIIANTADAVLAFDPAGHILVLNKEAEKLYASSSQQAVGHLFAEICLLEAHLDTINDLILHTVSQPNELLDQDVTITLADGSRQYFNVRTRLLLDVETQQRIGLIVVLSNITQREEAARERIESGMFMIMVVMALLIAMSVNGIILRNYPDIDVYSRTFNWTYTGFIVLPAVAYVVWMKKPLSEFGLTLHNWRQALLESGLISAGLFVGGAIVLTVLGASEGKTLTDFMHPERVGLDSVLYMPHSIMQEVIFRGIVLQALLRMFRDHSTWLPLFISSLLFGFLHTHLGLSAIFMTFLIGLLFGWMRLRHGNLLGASLAHVALGFSAFLFGIL